MRPADKRKPSSAARKRKTRRGGSKPVVHYPSLAEGPAPADRLVELLADAAKRGVHPLTDAEFDRMLDGPSDWPANEDIDDFLIWLRRERQEGRI